MNKKTETKEEQCPNNVIPMPGIELIPADYAISICMRNMFATYGEDKVRASLKELFAMDSDVNQTKKVG